jgi:hypothetical protein
VPATDVCASNAVQAAEAGIAAPNLTMAAHHWLVTVENCWAMRTWNPGGGGKAGKKLMFGAVKYTHTTWPFMAVGASTGFQFEETTGAGVVFWGIWILASARNSATVSCATRPSFPEEG